MKSITEKAYAKINISLDVTGRRPDGYHEMLMVMQAVTLGDRTSPRPDASCVPPAMQNATSEPISAAST